MNDRWVVPLGPNFEEFDTLSGQAIAEVESPCGYGAVGAAWPGTCPGRSRSAFSQGR